MPAHACSAAWVAGTQEIHGSVLQRYLDPDAKLALTGVDEPVVRADIRGMEDEFLADLEPAERTRLRQTLATVARATTSVAKDGHS